MGELAAFAIVYFCIGAVACVLVLKGRPWMGFALVALLLVATKINGSTP